MSRSVLITAGATRNPVDAIRVLTANASGRTGVSIGVQLARQGAEVLVLGSPEAALRAELAGLPAEVYGSTRDLMSRMEIWVRAHPGGSVVHSAAVGDYEVASSSSAKLPSQQSELLLRLCPTPKIADHLRAWGLSGYYVTFKAASPEVKPEELCQIAVAQRERTGCDLVFANVLGQLDQSVILVGERARPFADRDRAIEALVECILEASLRG
ncbi:MAG: hypothetical protein EA397_07525 [Deltaproteobacteria bacterium]|nr:MAG: hypothetical protein EA397_07525 [Deltaproteobacteria bacterium]